MGTSPRTSLRSRIMVAGLCPAYALLVLATLCTPGLAAIPLKADGHAGIWNQVLLGAGRSYTGRLGGLTIKSNGPIASLVDRDAPGDLASRWELAASQTGLCFSRAAKQETLSLDAHGHARFSGRVRVKGALRTRSLGLEGTPDGAALQMGDA